jgi:hypothetical protein
VAAIRFDMRQAMSAICLRIRCEEESMSGQSPQAGSDPTLKVGLLLVGSGFENVPSNDAAVLPCSR